MPTIKLTQAAVDRLKPPASGDIEYWDAHLPGFGLRVRSTGRKTWQVMLRVDGKPVRKALGTVATFPHVAERREAARPMMQMAAQGVDPRRRKVDKPVVETVKQVIGRYLQEYAVKRMRPDYYKETERALRVDVAEAIGGTAIDQVTRANIRRDVIAPIVARGREPHASHVLSYLRPFLGWAVDQEFITANPAEGIKDPDPRKKEDRERERYLGDDEIKIFWRACHRIGWPFGPLSQLLLLTGARRDEIAQATWDEFGDLKQRKWTLPRRRSKNKNEHVTHLADPVIAILEALPNRSKNGFLFSTTGSTAVSGFGRARERLIAAMTELSGSAIEPFTFHDLRRSFASGCAALGVAESIVDRCLNHSTRKISSTARTYNRYTYKTERAAALDQWATHVIGLVKPKAVEDEAVQS